jgi:hypothetical protein
MREYELEILEGVEMRAVESTDSIVYIVLPPPPGEEVSEEDLALVAGGGDTVATVGTLTTISCPVSTMMTAGTLRTCQDFP